MNSGFYPALGTPTGVGGTLVKDSFNRQVELMIEAGAQGVLCMGSMGKMETIRNKEDPLVAKQCRDVVNNRIPVLVGVMDCSIDRVLDRMDALESIKLDGVVTTVPFYDPLDTRDIVNFFKTLSKNSRYPVYIYDLPSVTQTPITIRVLKELVKETNIRGIKTGNLKLILELCRGERLRDDFSIFYSNLDLFDVAIKSGVDRNLDGMFTCTPWNSKKMYETGRDDVSIARSLSNILKLRNLFLKGNVLSAYSHAMELLNCPGNYHPDYALPIPDELKEEITHLMKEIHEI